MMAGITRLFDSRVYVHCVRMSLAMRPMSCSYMCCFNSISSLFLFRPLCIMLMSGDTVGGVPWVVQSVVIFILSICG